MFHLKSVEAIEYIRRLNESINKLIKQFERIGHYLFHLGHAKYEIGNVNFAPISLYYLEKLFERHLYLLEYYSNKGMGEAGIFITKTGFPSAPSLTADIKTIYDKISSKNPDLETRVKPSDFNIAGEKVGYRLSRMDLERMELSPKRFDKEFEEEFFSEFIPTKKDGARNKMGLDGKFLLDEKDEFFVLSEELKMPKRKRHLGIGDTLYLEFLSLPSPFPLGTTDKTNSRRYIHIPAMPAIIPKSRHNSIDERNIIRYGYILIDLLNMYSERSEYKDKLFSTTNVFRNILNVKYLDPYMYEIEQPILIAITHGGKAFSKGFMLEVGVIPTKFSEIIEENFKKEDLASIHSVGVYDNAFYRATSNPKTIDDCVYLVNRYLEDNIRPTKPI